MLFEKRPYKPGEAYAQSKLAVMLFTYELAKHLQGNCFEKEAVPNVH
jgi:NAD(P)-dependent dehydrogenase (short-subunit alcohol dehydrogenase family)